MEKVKRKKGWKFWIRIIIIIYCAVGIGLYYLQDKLLLHPKKLDAGYKFHFSVPFNELNIPLNDNENLDLIQFLPKDSGINGVILYFHGNAENVEHYANAANIFTSKGYEVWMPDYPGFGKTTGELTEQKLYDQSRIIYRLAAKKFNADSIFIYGRSFGSAIAARLAAYEPAKQLILETPYSSIPDLFNCYAPIYPMERMSKFKMPTYDFLKDVKIPITIFHGDADGVIPYRCAKMLKEVLKSNDEFITIKKGNHNNLGTFDAYKQKIDSLLR